MHIINATLKNAGKWDTYYSGLSMFVDSSIANVGFWILKNDYRIFIIKWKKIWEKL